LNGKKPNQSPVKLLGQPAIQQTDLAPFNVTSINQKLLQQRQGGGVTTTTQLRTTALPTKPVQ
jgi:hypothetical protein